MKRFNSCLNLLAAGIIIFVASAIGPALLAVMKMALAAVPIDGAWLFAALAGLFIVALLIGRAFARFLSVKYGDDTGDSL